MGSVLEQHLVIAENKITKNVNTYMIIITTIAYLLLLTVHKEDI